MKYKLLLLLIPLMACNDPESEVIKSNRNKDWKVEVIEGHEFLYRDADRSVAYIHRPNCKACKLKTDSEVIENPTF
jgi:hypothetical protein